MAKIETTFIRPKELYTPETGETQVVYDGYQNNPHELVVEENLEGEVSEIVNDTFVPNEGGNVVFTDNNETEHELITEDGFAGALDTAMPTALAKAQVIETTWQELKNKRDNGQLIAGSLYRITDYNCTTTQENTQSAGHQFDIVLLALSANKLAEEGWAMMHDNIYDVTFSDGVTKKCYLYDTGVEGEEYNIVEVATLGTTNNAILAEPQEFVVINEETKTAIVEEDSISLSPTNINLTYNYFQNSNLSAWKVWYCLDNDTTRFAWADTTNGKGVIYRLIDEFNNDVGYDFKNVLYLRKLNDGEIDAQGTDTYIPTFCLYDNANDEYKDASIFAINYKDDEGNARPCHNNFIGSILAIDLSIDSGIYALPQNIILAKVEEDDTGWSSIDVTLVNVFMCNFTNSTSHVTYLSSSNKTYVGDNNAIINQNKRVVWENIS